MAHVNPARLKIRGPVDRAPWTWSTDRGPGAVDLVYGPWTYSMGFLVKNNLVIKEISSTLVILQKHP
jgi:hypothetical protein